MTESTRDWLQMNGHTRVAPTAKAFTPTAALGSKPVTVGFMAKVVAGILDDERDRVERHIEDRLESLVGITKAVERENADRIQKIASDLDASLDAYLHSAVTVKGFGLTKHPLERTTYVEGLIAPIKRGHLTPDWFKDLLGPN